MREEERVSPRILTACSTLAHVQVVPSLLNVRALAVRFEKVAAVTLTPVTEMEDTVTAATEKIRKTQNQKIKAPTCELR